MNLFSSKKVKKQGNTHLQRLASVGMVSTLILAHSLVSALGVSAEVLNRAQGRCKLRLDDYTSFDGYCEMKHKQNNRGEDTVTIELDNNQQYRFSGPNMDSLQVTAWDGVHNVRHEYRDDHEVFDWNTGGQRNRLSVKLDNQYPTDVSHDDDTGEIIGAIAGAGLGLLIGSLIGGGDDSDDDRTSNNSFANNPYAGNSYYDATTSFPCSVGNADKDQLCPAGIKRYGGGRASVVVQFPNNYEVQYDFNDGEITSSFGDDLTWGKQGDTWSIGIDGEVFIDIPEAAVYGG